MVFRQDISGSRGTYFERLQSALTKEGICQPVMIIDVDRLDANTARLKKTISEALALRIVAKSLAVPSLLERVMGDTCTNRLMTFNLPMLSKLTALYPEADHLLGKPFPAAAANQFIRARNSNDALAHIRWLIDTPERLAQYSDAAEASNTTLDIVFEIDVGLHRGGFQVGEDLASAVRKIAASSNLSFGGLMGYEAHIGKAPSIFGIQERTATNAKAKYRKANRIVSDILGQEKVQSTLRNVGGSPTFSFYKDSEIANEIAVGSALLKPTDFDLPQLDQFEPAFFIGAPVLKVFEQMQTPVLESLDGIKRWLNPNTSKSVFIHGGYWKARPVDPPGLQFNATYGRSSNQEILNAGKHLSLNPDDFVFLRPTQSEAILCEFGPIAVYSNGAIQDWWEPFTPSP